MKIFDKDDKLNFVDENNVVLGFDSHQECCEHFGYYISKTPSKSDQTPYEKEMNVERDSERLSNYRFDPDYFLKIENKDEYGSSEGGSMAFKLINQNDKTELYLTIYNIHNGYYGHGFSFMKDGEIVTQGCI